MFCVRAVNLREPSERRKNVYSKDTFPFGHLFSKPHNIYKQPHYVCEMRVAFGFFCLLHISRTFLLCGNLSLSLSLSEQFLVLCRILMYKYYKCPAVWPTFYTSKTCDTYARYFVVVCLLLLLRSVVSSHRIPLIVRSTDLNVITMHKNVSTLVYVKFIILLKFHTHECISHIIIFHIYLKLREKTSTAHTGRKKSMNKIKWEALRWFFLIVCIYMCLWSVFFSLSRWLFTRQIFLPCCFHIGRLEFHLFARPLLKYGHFYFVIPFVRASLS